MPDAMVAVIAGRPSFVAGILTSRFARPTRSYSSRACAMVPAVSVASPGSTSIETRPSRPCVASNTGVKRSQAWRTSAVVRSVIASSIPTPDSFSRATWWS